MMPSVKTTPRIGPHLKLVISAQEIILEVSPLQRGVVISFFADPVLDAAANHWAFALGVSFFCHGASTPVDDSWLVFALRAARDRPFQGEAADP
jgi:hypothetical protein